MTAWGLSSVDLLKIDAEGDELNVLRGVRAADWPRIQQVVCEVHDVHDRLRHCVSLLRRHGFSVQSTAQTGGEVDAYMMVIPATLRLHYVYASRHPSGKPSTRKREKRSPRAASGLRGERRCRR